MRPKDFLGGGGVLRSRNLRWSTRRVLESWEGWMSKVQVVRAAWVTHSTTAASPPVKV